jgi:hypothetical protein
MITELMLVWGIKKHKMEMREEVGAKWGGQGTKEEFVIFFKKMHHSPAS